MPGNSQTKRFNKCWSRATPSPKCRIASESQLPASTRELRSCRTVSPFDRLPELKRPNFGPNRSGNSVEMGAAQMPAFV